MHVLSEKQAENIRDFQANPDRIPFYARTVCERINITNRHFNIAIGFIDENTSASDMEFYDDFTLSETVNPTNKRRWEALKLCHQRCKQYLFVITHRMEHLKDYIDTIWQYFEVLSGHLYRVSREKYAGAVRHITNPANDYRYHSDIQVQSADEFDTNQETWNGFAFKYDDLVMLSPLNVRGIRRKEKIKMIEKEIDDGVLAKTDPWGWIRKNVLGPIQKRNKARRLGKIRNTILSERVKEFKEEVFICENQFVHTGEYSENCLHGDLHVLLRQNSYQFRIRACEYIIRQAEIVRLNLSVYKETDEWRLRVMNHAKTPFYRYLRKETEEARKKDAPQRQRVDLFRQDDAPKFMQA